MRFALLFVLMLSVLAACAQQPPSTTETVRPTATIAPFFSGADRPLPTIDIPTPEPRATSAASRPSSGGVPILAATAERDPMARVVDEVTIYAERLDPNWSERFTFGHNLDLESSDTAASGFVSLRAVPTTVFGGTMLTLNEDSRRLFPRDEVLGLRFEVSGGDMPLAPFNLIVKMLGSNRYPFFVEDDGSVAFEPGQETGRPVFDEVGLDQLGLRRELEVGEWAEVELWFDDYDQVDYTYITGIVILNDQSYTEPFYVDNVRLLVRRP